MSIIIKPLVTEKMEKLSAKQPRYGFIVDINADRLQVKRAVEEFYGVTVESVNTMRYAGKRSSRYTKTGMIEGRTKNFKKAIVTLKEGQTIDFFSNI